MSLPYYCVDVYGDDLDTVLHHPEKNLGFPLLVTQLFVCERLIIFFFGFNKQLKFFMIFQSSCIIY